MGFLHKGHLSLVKKSKQENDITIVSIFVNPTQFAPNEDFSAYPRDHKRDEELLTEEKIDLLFMPSPDDIYPRGYKTYVVVEGLTSKFEGDSRPTHFKGVTTIVNILFNIVNPDRAYFGQKDAQQAAIINRMVKDLRINIEVVICPIIREPDGLAMSSRNVYLNDKERQDALVLSKALLKADRMISEGERDTKTVIKEMKMIINSVDTSDFDYIKIVDAESFEELKMLHENNSYFVLIACKIGKTRLIDNITVII